jgi:hypothetical protein
VLPALLHQSGVGVQKQRRGIRTSEAEHVQDGTGDGVKRLIAEPAEVPVVLDA